MSEERRRDKRMTMESKLLIKRLDGGGSAEEVNIEIIDVSKSGVGFTCNKALEIGAIYESFLTIWTKEVLHAFLEIVRIEKRGDVYHYGSTFVGLPEMEAMRIETYQTIAESEGKV
ncbi:MAG: PilZ domain-containing protein [Lachnospiraceae bacterium]|nr:PilZ domain-containing protein [Lachnospiraceae bacterium]